MAPYTVVILHLLSFSSYFAKKKDVNLASIAQIDDTFICVAIDWWPLGKCNYNQSLCDKTSILNLDLVNFLLSKSLKVFNPIRIRLGESMQD